MTEAETVALLVALLVRQEPFVHCRFGDGDVFFATGTGPKITADGEEWSRELQRLLLDAWFDLWRSDTLLLLGDLETYAVSDGCEREWGLLRQVGEWVADRSPQWVHMEALRAGFGYAIPFYQAVARDPRRKTFVGPYGLRRAATMLDTSFVEVPLATAWQSTGAQFEAIWDTDPELVLLAAGRSGKLIQAWLAQSNPGLTQIDVGSGLDILFTDLRRSTDAEVNVDALIGDYREAGLLT